MKPIVLACLLTAASPAVAACPWADDADMANALSDSRWQVEATRGMRVESMGAQFSVSLVAELDPMVLTIGPLLRGNTLDDLRLYLTLVDPDTVENGKINAGSNTFEMGPQRTDGSPCANADLSALVLAADPESRFLETWMTLHAESRSRFVGILKVRGETSTNGVGAGLYQVTATPLD